MVAVGKVVAIINENHLLIESSVRDGIKLNEELMVYGEADSSQLKESLGLSKITFPKGRILIVARQNEMLFLGSVVRYRLEHRAKFAKGTIGSLQSLLGPTEEVEIPVTIEERARLNTQDSVEIDLDRAVNVGDAVSREGI